MVFLEIEKLTKNFEEVVAVDSVSFSVSKGEILGILGPSGCGKTTILKVILGLLTPTIGDIRLEGESIVNIPPELRNFGYIPQNLALFPHLPVFENIAFGLKAKKWKNKNIMLKTKSLIKLLKLQELESKLPHEISGGQQQRVALARALAPEPTLLLMDEPLTSLDTTLSFHLRWEVRKVLKATTTTAIFVTHNPEEAISICDRLVLMDSGKTLQTVSSKEVFTSPTSVKVLQIMGKSNIFPIIKIIEDEKGEEVLLTSLGSFPRPDFTRETLLSGFWIPETEIIIQKTHENPNDSFRIDGELVGIIWGRTKHKLIFQLHDNNQLIVQIFADNISLPTIGESLSLIVPHKKIHWF
ncbi:MAG: ABC transporter ATP-binding protein [Candidatus Heimdallarchaeota archaeon]|nr:MAG: ABC transporter ATP-binding protein [Candidatus Heimdallarchaeota archaeon]